MFLFAVLQWKYFEIYLLINQFESEICWLENAVFNAWTIKILMLPQLQKS
jgi:hypothetical protein